MKPITPALLVAAVFVAAAASARTLYVSTTGNDAHSGTVSAPYATLWRAFGAAVDGDVILLKAGTYPAACAPSKRVTLGSWSGRATVRPSDNHPPVIVTRPSDQTATLDQWSAVARVHLDWTYSDADLPSSAAGRTTSLTLLSGAADRCQIVRDVSPAGFDAYLTAAGTYTLRFSVSDGEYTVWDDVTVTVQENPIIIDPQPVNHAPAVTVAPVPVIRPGSIAWLDASISDDGLPKPPACVTQVWTQVSGPGAALLANATSTHASARLDSVGTYVFRITAGDSQLSTPADVTVRVESGPDDSGSLVVRAGPAQTVTLPARANMSGSVTYNGSAPPAGRVTVTWSKYSGPGSVDFADAHAAVTTAGFTTSGIYVLRLTAAYGLLTSSGDVTISVHPNDPVNQRPVVSAGANSTVLAPAPVPLHGSVSDDGLPRDPGQVTCRWTKVSGPGNVSFADAASPATTAAFSEVGTYVLRLTAFDGQLGGSNQVQVLYTGGPSCGKYVRGGITYAINGRYGFAPGAAVSAVRDGVVFARTTADAQGKYQLTGLPCGTYSLHAEYGGYYGDWCCVAPNAESAQTVIEGCNVLVSLRRAAMTLASSPPSGQLSAPEIQPDGSVVLFLAGWPGVEYEVQRSENLADWTSFLDVVCTDLESKLVDPQPTSSGSCFYRLKVVSY